MNCPYCKTKNPDNSKFCNNCGKPLILSDIGSSDAPNQSIDEITCPKCNAKNPKTFKFCMNCGGSLESLPKPEPAQMRAPGTIKFITAKCPECGSSLQVEENRDMAFCSYCGAKVIIHNENEYITRNIDEAEIRKAEVEAKRADTEAKRVETENYIKLQELHDSRKGKKGLLIGFIVGIVLTMIGWSAMATENNALVGLGVLAMFGPFIALYTGCTLLFGKGDDGKPDASGKVTVPDIVQDLRKKNYQTVESAFISRGFFNVECIPMNDLTFGVMKKPGEVDTVTINGSNASVGRKYDPSVKVVISYHSFQ